MKYYKNKDQIWKRTNLPSVPSKSLT
jgi:hypothetical protein